MAIIYIVSYMLMIHDDYAIYSLYIYINLLVYL